MLGVEFFKYVGFKFTVESNGFDNFFTLFMTCLLYEVSNLGRVKFCKLTVWNTKSSRRNVTYKWLNGREVNNRVSFNTLANVGSENAAKEWTTSRVNTNYFPLSVHLCNFNFVRNDETTANQVNEVARK